MASKTIKRIFIANRGEICRRIAISARSLGIESATLSPTQTPPLYLQSHIDHFCFVDGGSRQSYLDTELILNLAKESGCDAVHPGFGFMSENDQFADACQAAGLIWIGPNSEAMRAMASKDAARDLAKSAGVPVNEAMQGIDLEKKTDWAAIKSFANNAGYPLLVKAAYGGGGKGMRLVEEESRLEEAVTRCHSEAKSSFGNGLLLIEKFITRPRHIEVQILGSSHGQVCSVGDRDCSVQRRHQKIIEEAPAPDLTPRTRAAMHEAAIGLSRAVNYDSAGTVEFLLDAAAEERDGIQPFFFLEMNTRLQVEHPVTEETCGIDLVAWQIRVAQGARLPESFGSIEPRGHSVEARVYAEDPEQGFLPSPGPIYCFEPVEQPGVRWEVGVDRIDIVSPDYDPMIAKCIATAESRTEACRRLEQALEQTVLLGTKTNRQYLRAILSEQEFLQGGITTKYLEESGTDLTSWLAKEEDKYRETSEALLADAQQNRATLGNNNQSLRERVFARSAPARGGEKAEFLTQSTTSHHFPKAVAETRRFRTPEGKLATIATLKIAGTMDSWIHYQGAVFSAKIEEESIDRFQSSAEQSDAIVAPVPGKVISVARKAGDKVLENEVVLILESMKMEFEVKAPRDGILKDLSLGEGDQVTAGQILARWE